MSILEWSGATDKNMISSLNARLTGHVLGVPVTRGAMERPCDTQRN